MTVWYIVMRFPAPSETFVANDVAALKRLGVDVSVHALLAASADAGRLLDERGLAGVSVTHGKVGNVLRGFVVGVARPLLAVQLLRWAIRHSGGRPAHVVKGLALLPRILELFDRLEHERPDVVHLYWGHYPAIFGWLVLEHAPAVVVSLQLVAYDLQCGFPGTTAVARRAHVVTTCATANVTAIAVDGISRDAVHVYLHGIDREKVKGRRFDKVPHRVITVARLIPGKGVDDVLRAFARLKATCPDAELVILGDGPERRRLERLAASLGVAGSTAFRGHVPHDEVFEELARAELLLFLSHSERLPNVVKEAMACRCVVVATATLGIEELMDDGVHGWVVPVGAWEQAAERAAAAFAAPESSQAMAAGAQEHVLQKFDLMTLMRGLVRKWEEQAVQQRVAPGRFPSQLSTPEAGRV